MRNEYISILLRSEKTVFTFKELLLMWREMNSNLAKKRLYRYVKNGTLLQIRKGIYAKDEDYDRMELANKIYTPSYISFETVLTREGIVFQHYDSIFVASYLSREITAGGQPYVFHKIKDKILTSNLSLVDHGRYFMASKERAFLDTVYLNRNYHFDNLSGIDWNKCFDLVPLYKNTAMENRLKSYQKQAHNA